MDVKELQSGADPAVHWYYQTKKLPLFRAFEKVRTRHPGSWLCVDIGAGSGFFSEALADEFPNDIRKLIQVDTAYSEAETEAKTKTATTHFPVVRRQRELPDRIEDGFVLLMDVLEHLADEDAFLSQLRRRGRGENRFFATAPAFQSLWSYHDVSLGHHRRYSRSHMAAVLTRAGFRVERSYYIYATVFPLVWLMRRMRARSRRAEASHSDMGPVAPPLNRLLLDLNRLEMRWSPPNRLWGLTCVAEGSF